MRRRRKILGSATAMVVILGGVLGASMSLGLWATDRAEGGTAAGSLVTACPSAESRRTTQIATAKLIIEFNATDNDLGVHGAFDDQGWKILCVFDPNGRAVLEVGPQGQLRDLTMAGIFFESRVHGQGRVVRWDNSGRQRHLHPRCADAAEDHLTPNRRRLAGREEEPAVA
jgi:hypothetical protein